MPADVVSMPDTSQKFLSADDIILADDLETLSIYVREWKGTVQFRAMSADAAINFQDSLTGPQKKQALVRLFQLCAVDQDGNCIFSPSKLEQLRKKSWPVLLRLQKPLMQLNGFMTPDKSWATVEKLLADAGVEDDVIQKAAELWKVDDESLLKND